MALHPAGWLAAVALAVAPGGSILPPKPQASRPLEPLRAAHPTDAQRVMPGLH